MKIRKKLLRTTMIVAAGLVPCFATPASHAGTTLWVGGCHAGSYSTIGGALAVASAGTTINVCPGYYAEQVTIALDNITLQGVAFTSVGETEDAAVIIPPAGGMVPNGQIFDTDNGPGSAAAQIVVQNVVGVTISHITVDAQSSQSCSSALIGIYYQDSSGTVTNSVARNQITSALGSQCGWGIAAESDGTGPAGATPIVTVSNNSVHNFQKNGIVARGNNSTGPNLIATGNTVIGIGAVANDAAQNGIEVAFGATGSVKANYVADLLYTGGPSAGGTGILFYAAIGTPVAETNVVDSANTGIATVLNSSFGPGGNDVTIMSNHIGGTQMFDGIDLCSSNDTANGNIIYNSANSGVHIDAECGGSSGTLETVKSNTIAEACAGILTGTSATPGTYNPNTYANDGYETSPGDTCTPPPGPNNQVVGKSGEQLTAKGRKPRP